MHKCKGTSEPSVRLPRRRNRAGFSLVEVSMALAIVAFAFVALIGLLPAGMKIFEAATITTAETRIVAHLSSLLEASDYSQIQSSNITSTSYYYDVDGSFLDSSSSPVDAYANKRIYVARMILDAQNIPNGSTSFDTVKTGCKVEILMGRNDKTVLDEMAQINTVADVANLKSDTRVKFQPVMITRMDIEQH